MWDIHGNNNYWNYNSTITNQKIKNNKLEVLSNNLIKWDKRVGNERKLSILNEKYEIKRTNWNWYTLKGSNRAKLDYKIKIFNISHTRCMYS